MANEINTYRYERKFLVSDLSKYEIEALVKLNPAMFSEIYYERIVNNIYFDSLGFHNYYANVDGLKDRTKCRIRWYGEMLGHIKKPVLELKIKSGLLGRKRSFPLIPFTVDEHFKIETISEVLKQSQVPGFLEIDLSVLQPSLLNRYTRRYFQSADRKFRITIDTNLEYYRINPFGETFLKKTVDTHNVVVELKYDQDLDHLAGKISAHFPFRMTKNSKYVVGVQNVNHIW